jgi:hypothetical protein
MNDWSRLSSFLGGCGVSRPAGSRSEFGHNLLDNPYQILAPDRLA